MPKLTADHIWCARAYNGEIARVQKFTPEELAAFQPGQEVDEKVWYAMQRYLRHHMRLGAQPLTRFEAEGLYATLKTMGEHLDAIVATFNRLVSLEKYLIGKGLIDENDLKAIHAECRKAEQSPAQAVEEAAANEAEVEPETAEEADPASPEG